VSGVVDHGRVQGGRTEAVTGAVFDC